MIAFFVHYPNCKKSDNFREREQSRKKANKIKSDNLKKINGEKSSITLVILNKF